MNHQVDTDELGRLPCQLRPAAVGKSYLELLRSDGILAAGRTKTKHEKNRLRSFGSYGIVGVREKIIRESAGQP